MKLAILAFGSSDFADSCRSAICAFGDEVNLHRVESLTDLDRKLGTTSWDLLVLDYNCAAARKVDIAFFSRQYGAKLPVIVNSENSDVGYVADLQKAGASAVLREWDPDMFYLQSLQAMESRRRADRRVIEKTELLDRLSEAIIICNYDGCISYWNRGAETLYGFSSSNAVGKDVNSLLPNARTGNFQAIRRIVWEKGEWVGKLPQVGYDGKTFTVLSRCSIILSETGRPEALLMVNTPADDKSHSEEQFIRSQRLECIGTLADGLSHDLNNVFTPILMAAYLLRSKLEDPSLLKMVDTLETSALRGADIVKQVMTIAQNTEGEHKLIQPKHILRDIVNIVKETFPKKVSLESNIPRDLPAINADALQLQQMLLNITFNAKDAVQADGDSISIIAETVELDQSHVDYFADCEKPGEYIRIEISDNGSGISDSDLDHVFDPFFTTHGIGTHTGLGLSTARAIARGHGGFISIKSTLQQGTTVEIYLPVPHDDVRRNVHETTEERFFGNGETILIIDDEKAFCLLAEQTLTEIGYNVLTAANGAEGVALYASNADTIKVVVTDLLMPVMDGIATITALRKINTNCKIIATSGYSQTNMVEKAKKLADFFIPRPFTANKLLEAIRSLILLQKV